MTTTSETAIIFAPRGRDAAIATAILGEAGIDATPVMTIAALVAALENGAGFALIAEDALRRADLRLLDDFLKSQAEWSDFAFILLTERGDSLACNPIAACLLETLGNVTFLERPFDPTMLVSLAKSALRARRRQYDARARLDTIRQGEETIGQLSGGVAHDFNNLLTPIVGSLDILRRKLDGDDDAQRMAAAGLQSAARAKTLINRLLAFARRQELDPQPVDVAALVVGMKALIARSIGPMIDVKVILEPDIARALIDPIQLELSLLNLCVNARDAIAGSGTITITVSQRFAGPDEASGLARGEYVAISVKDTGCGMDAETLRRSVEPFFTTKEIGKGTGLGLSMVHGLVAQLGGAMAIESEHGIGTTIAIYLPIAADTALPPTIAPRAAADRNAAFHAAQILLVDDEPIVRLATAYMLRDAGYEVMEASSGEQARAFVCEGMQPDLLVTDQLMPGIKGTELAGELVTLIPELRVLIATGYSDLPDNEFPRISKPYGSRELVQRVAELLEI